MILDDCKNNIVIIKILILTRGLEADAFIDMHVFYLDIFLEFLIFLSMRLFNVEDIFRFLNFFIDVSALCREYF